jgi:hypothetical protein
MFSSTKARAVGGILAVVGILASALAIALGADPKSVAGWVGQASTLIGVAVPALIKHDDTTVTK